MCRDLRPSLSTLVLAFCLIAVHALAGDPESLQGKLASDTGKPALLVEDGRRVPLHSGDEAIAATIGDPEISGKELKVVGDFDETGSFEVRDYFVVRDGELQRLVYFCDTCNITTFHPGECVCCRRQTVPMEVPLTDPRVRRVDIP